MTVINPREGRAQRRSRSAMLGLVAIGALGLAACDLGVSAPDRIEEIDLFIPEAVPAIVNGARYSFGLATTLQGAGGVYSASAALTDEVTHVGSWVPPREISDGVPGNASPENQSHWNFTSRARWQAEDAISKVSEILPEPNQSDWMATATLYAGFANRVLGDNFCEVVFDGGELQPHTAAYDRALDHFTNAISIANAAGNDELRDAAYAGRAQIHAMLGNWGDAVSDAGQVATNFVYVQPHSDNTGSENNGVYEWTARPAGQYSVWGTPFAEWGLDLSGEEASEGDPRVPYRSLSGSSDGAPALLLGGDNRRPYWFAQKYTSFNDPTPIAKGTEMRLIEAEARLRASDVPGAVAAINEVRAFHGLADAAAANADEAWQLLMKERGIELWLEGRRLADLRRWAAEPSIRSYIQTTAVRGEATGEGTGPEDDPRVNVLEADPFCLRIGTDEINSNEHLRANPPT